MAKALTIQIKSAGAALKGFREPFKNVEAGRQVNRRAGVYFTSIEAARNLLTPNRLAVLRAVRSGRPGSIYEPAKYGPPRLEERPRRSPTIGDVRADPHSRRDAPAGYRRTPSTSSVSPRRERTAFLRMRQTG